MTWPCYLSDFILPSPALVHSTPVICAKKEQEGFLGVEAASRWAELDEQSKDCVSLLLSL